MKSLIGILDYTHTRFDTRGGTHLGRMIAGPDWDRSNRDGMDLMLEETRDGRWFLADFHRYPEYARFPDVFDGTEASNPTLHKTRRQALERALRIASDLRPDLTHSLLREAIDAEQDATSLRRPDGAIVISWADYAKKVSASAD
ncbi:MULTISPECIES: hypothetical protein [unclassified Burkholderia]|uniref:hypothetical protein n=1 Tax=unclassified Burkholderia TaxID=2613784 RepID=UPI002AAFFA47|nr:MULTISPECIES: hypothetical protein [unclassified Burkholderia]